MEVFVADFVLFTKENSFLNKGCVKTFQTELSRNVFKASSGGTLPVCSFDLVLTKAIKTLYQIQMATFHTGYLLF